ncbi:hypothetical protein IAD21_04429 [Abditibacteriota bacterium]|nr:hypothetical protein IAD21_04429 [Abditibacteriota bacterium]
MKNPLHSSSKSVTICLAATGFTGTTLAWAAPKTDGPPLVQQKLNEPTPHVTNLKSSPAAEPPYKPSGFPGVSVRSIPQPQPRRVTRAVPHRGLVLRNIRRIPGSKTGYMADIDPASYPSTVFRMPTRTVKKAAPKAGKR